MSSYNRLSVAGFIALAVLSVGAFFVSSQLVQAVSFTGTFTTNQTVANVTAGADTQTFVNANVIANVPGGADNTQAAVLATTFNNISAMAASTTVDSNVVLTANVAGTTGNVFSITITSTDTDLGASTNATIDVSKTGNDIAVTVQHNTNVDAAGVGAGVIDVTRATVVAALNMSASGSTQGGLVDVTITDDVSGDITASGGDATKVGSVVMTSLMGGVDNQAQVNTVTPSNVEIGDIFTVTINSLPISFTATAASVDNVTAGLTSAINLSAQGANVTAVDNTTEIEITADVAGTPFTITSGATNLPGIAQVDDVTPALIEAGDSFTISGVTGTPITIIATDSLEATLVDAFVTAINATSTKTVTASNSSNVLRLTADVAGTAFTVTPSNLNRPAVAQVVTFTPASPTIGETFRATINGIDYDYTVTGVVTVKTVVEALQPLMDANPDVDCSEDDTKVTCTASVPGTSFTFAGTVVDITAPVISSVSYSPTIGTMAIGDVLTLTINADGAGYTAGAITVNGVAVTGFVNSSGNTYTAYYTVGSGDTDRANSDQIPVSVVLVDASLNSSAAFTTAPAAGLTPAIDANAPAAPSTPDLAAASDSGSSSTDNITASTTPVFSGTAEVGSTVNLHAGAAFIGSAVAASGSWSITSSALADGTYSITGTATDVVGNLGATSTALSIIIDTTAPVIAPQATSTAEATSASGAVVTYTSPATSDAVDGASIATCLPASGSTFALGTTTVTCTKKDAAGNSAVATTFSVVVVDTTPPVIAARGSRIVEATGPSGATVTYFIPATTDAVDGAGTATCLAASGTLFAVGTTTVTCNKTDAHGNVATPTTFSVVVQDTTAPTISSHSNVTAQATSASGAVVTYTAPNSSDIVDGTIAASCLPTSGSTFALGNTTVTCSKTDAHGNVATPKTFTVSVVDTTKPVIAAHADVSAEATSASGAVITYTAPTATDAVDGALPASCTPVSGSTFAVGTTTITCTKTDAHSNVATPTTFKAVVYDTTAPVIASHATVTAEATSPSGAAVIYTSPDSTDAVDGTIAASCTATSGSTFAIGTTTVTCTKTDAHGNVATPTTFSVVVVDTTAPVITLNGTASMSVVLGNTYVEPGAVANDAFDGTDTVVIGGATVDTATPGSYVVMYDAVDAHSNVATQVTRTVTVSATTLAVTAPSGVLTNAATSTTTSGTSVMSVEIPAGVTITGDSTWDGTFALPTVSTSYTSPTPVSGTSVTVRLALEVGSSTSALTFDKGVRIVFPGMAGERVGWSRNGTFTEISTTCAANTQVAGDALASGADCKIDSGADLVVWTKHFTTFLVFTQFTSSSSSGGGSGGGGGGGSSVAFNPTPSAPTAQGQVLGAEAYNFRVNLTVGSRGVDVTELQKILIAEGHLKIGTPTGTFGPLTLAAVKLYQKAHGITPQSGYVGPLTRAELNKGTTPVTTSTTTAQQILSLQAQVAILQAKIKAALGY